MRERVHVNRTMKDLVADLRIKKMCAKIKNQKMTDKNYQNIRVA